jgi:anti-anti-sigma regulatory factor
MKARLKKPGARGTAAVASSRKPATRKLAPRKTASRSAARTAASAKSPATRLGTDCTIEHAPALHKQLAKLLADRACVTLDFTAVKRCDTAGMQVLAAFVRERREAGRKLELAGMSESFVVTAQLLGLGAVFAAEDARA